MRQDGSTRLNCFSPPVMVATVIIEVSLALYSAWRYKLTELSRLIIITLVALATFQVAEYFVCTGSIGHGEQWSRVGFIAITTLPALGTHIMHVLAGKPRQALVWTAYATMAGFIIFFLTYSGAFVGHQCTGNYVIFQLGSQVGGAYSIYYYGWLLIGFVLGARWANGFMSTKGQAARTKLETVRGLMIGYLVFLVPTALANTVKPATRRGIPSIMCGFAVLFALILALYILPRAAEAKQPSRVDKTA